MTATKDDATAEEQAKVLARSVEYIVQMIRDPAEEKKAVVYGASSILAMIASELMDRMGFPHEQVADVQIRTDLIGDATIVITWKKPEDE